MHVCMYECVYDVCMLVCVCVCVCACTHIHVCGIRARRKHQPQRECWFQECRHWKTSDGTPVWERLRNEM